MKIGGKQIAGVGETKREAKLGIKWRESLEIAKELNKTPEAGKWEPIKASKEIEGRLAPQNQ